MARCRTCSRDLPAGSKRLRCRACHQDHMAQSRAEKRVLVDQSVAIDELRNAAKALRAAGFDMIANGVDVAIYRLQQGEAHAAVEP